MDREFHPTPVWKCLPLREWQKALEILRNVGKMAVHDDTVSVYTSLE